YTAILGTLDGEFGEFVQGLDGSIEEIVQTGVTARQAFVTLSDASERLDLRFNDTTASAYEAASSLAEMAGGVQNLSSLQQNYYQTLYSEEERLNQLRSDITQQLNAMGMSLPSTRDGFRQLVEAQNLNTEAGRRNYTQLLQLVDGFDRLRESASSVNDETSELADKISGLKDDVKSAWETFDKQSFDQRITLLEMAGKSEEALALQRERELATIDESLRPIQERIWSLQDEAKAQEEAAQAGKEYAQALADAQSWLGSTLENIAGWIDRNQSTDAGLNSPADQLAAAGAAYREQLEAAQGGDRSALQNITQYADRFIAAQKQWSASGGDTTALIDRIERQLGNLPDQLSAEEYIADEIKQALIEQTDGITSELAEVLRSDTPSNIAGALAGSFDDLTRGIGDVLTREQLATVMSGKATDAQLDALMRTVDLNGDGVMSGLESVIIKSMPTDAALANALRQQLKANGNKALTAAEVRQALRPIASDQRINQLIDRVDANGDGLLSAQELTSSRLGGLADGIAASLSGAFDQLDANLDDNLTFDELKDGLSGMATDAQIKALMRSMDVNADGVISGLESVVIESMPSDSRLANVLRNQFKWTRNQQLTADQVRDALQGKASNERINQLIRRADTNADGIIDATELASDVATSELSGVLAKQLGWTRDQIKWTRNQQLTADEVRDALKGKASNERINQMIRRADTNADGIIDATELASDASTSELSQVLSNQLKWTRNQIKWTRNSQLTHDQVREALSPIASNDEIDRLITRLDKNSDGIISAQEMASERLDGLAAGIGNALLPMFDTLDSSLDGLIDYDEFGKQFAGMASDEQLKKIFAQLDADGDGTISRLEALKGSTDQVDENTQSLEERALDQVTRLGNLVDEMTRTTDQFVDMNSTMVSLRDSINALGVAQEEQNRIERERREAKERQEKRLEKERAASGYLERANELEQQAQDQTLFDNLDGITAKRSDTIVDNIMAQAGNDKILSWDEYQSALDDMQTRRDKGWYNDGEFDFAKTAALSLRKQSRYHEMMDDAAGLTGDDYSGRIDQPNFGGVQEELKGLSDAERARSFFTRYSDYASSWKIWRGTLDYDWDRWTGNILTTPISDAALIRMAKELDRDFAGPSRFFAKGGVFTNSIVDQPTMFDMGVMGEAGPEAIVPLAKMSGGDLGIRAEMPPIPALPLLGQGDMLEVLQDMRQELRVLRRENHKMQQELAAHAAAGVAVSQEGFKRVDRNTARIADTNDAIDDRQRLEAQR
ncbi:EF-hand domain-containing protein, partial [Halomonas elongata]|uniref:EF-hand domain-containing protein n=1 Tax=Halomonas elongata TaxID=2746 RepID=UPI00255ABED8